MYDFVLLDEGQDLDVRCFAIVTHVARHVTVCMDHNQQIYDRGCREDDVITALKLKRRQISLLDTFRCCPYITAMAATFVGDDRQRAAFLQQTRTAQTEIETPVIYQADGVEDARAHLMATVATRVQAGERVGILLPQKRQVFGVAKGLREKGFDVETQKELDFSSDTPKVITYHSAKGLTFDSVLLPLLTEHSFPRTGGPQLERLLFVALTRATRWVYLSPYGRLPQLDRLQVLIDAGKIALRSQSMQVDRVDRQAKDGDNDLLDAL